MSTTIEFDNGMYFTISSAGHGSGYGTIRAELCQRQRFSYATSEEVTRIWFGESANELRRTAALELREMANKILDQCDDPAGIVDSQTTTRPVSDEASEWVVVALWSSGMTVTFHPDENEAKAAYEQAVSNGACVFYALTRRMHKWHVV